MHKLSSKFIVGVVSILVLMLFGTLLVNERLVERYYTYRQKAYIDRICQELETQLRNGQPAETAIAEIERQEKVFIVRLKNTEDNDKLNEKLQEGFREKGLGFQKFWLWDQDYVAAMQNGKKIRIYNQEKLNYGIVTEYIPIGDYMYAVAAILPDAEEAIRIINRIVIVLNLCSLLVSLLLISLLVKNITRPLKDMERFAEDISNQNFGVVTVRTHDELQTVAESMNRMSERIQEYQKTLICKNQQLEELLDNVAHDLKTPISLIQMYAAGIQDGLDDGTFPAVIEAQGKKMAFLVEQLLALSRIGQKEYCPAPVLLDQLLTAEIRAQEIAAAGRGIPIKVSVEQGAVVSSVPELVESLFSNLISNAIKYAAQGEITVTLAREDSGYHVCISNEILDADLDTERIWEPFYVAEASRNKELSGTGLGLAIVKKTAEQLNSTVGCHISGNRIFFDVYFAAPDHA